MQLQQATQAGTTRQEFLARAAGLGRREELRLSVENVRVDGNTTHLDVVRDVPTGGLLGLARAASPAAPRRHW